MDMGQILQEYPHCFSADAMTIPWIHSPFFKHLLAQAELSTEEKTMVETFGNNGYIVVDPEVPEEVIDRAVADLKNRYAGDSDSNLSRLQDAWKISDAIKSIATAPKILSLLQMLYRREAIPFQTLNFRVGTEQRTHSDTIHFQSHPANWMCGVWVALEDVDSQNGPLHYYPGSHRLPLYDLDPLDLHASYDSYPSYEDFVEALLSDGPFQRQEVTMKKGQALIWSANLFHGGSKILDPQRTRLSQVTHYYFKGCMYYTPMNSDIFLGNICFRTDDLMDIRTSTPIRHSYKGRPIRPIPRREERFVPARYPGITEDPTDNPFAMRATAVEVTSTKFKIKRLAKKFVPPIVFEARHRLLNERKG